MATDPRHTSRFKLPILACAVVFLAAHVPSVVHAGIISSSNVTLLGGPPAPGVHNTDQPLGPPIVFPEFINGIVPAGGVRVDHNGSVVTANPPRTGNVISPSFVYATIPAGTAVDSYFFHFDPDDLTADLSNFYFSARVEFDTKILGVQIFTAGDASLTPHSGTLEDGDTIDVSGAPGVQTVVSLNGGPPNTYYPGLVLARGLDGDDGPVTIDLSGNRITLTGKAFGTEVDQVRIFVASVPEPGSIALAASGLMALSFLAITRLGAIRRS